MSISVTSYEALCNLGNNIDEIYQNALVGNSSCFNDKRLGEIHCELPIIQNPDYNIRCNQLLLKTMELIEDKVTQLLANYAPEKIGVIVATTNSGVEEYEASRNSNHYVLANPACFLQKKLGLKGFFTTVSTACSSGIKAFSLARDLLNNNICHAVLVACVDSIAKVPVYGFGSLEVLTSKPSMAFSKNRTGMNIGEASSIFILEKDVKDGIEVKGIGETSDIYHPTTPDPKAYEASRAIELALKDAKIQPNQVDYINAHGTGTIANDIMEATAISTIFSNKTPVSSTKPMTGHCLGAAAGIETALCCKLLDDFRGKFYPHLYDGVYDDELPEIKLVAVSDEYSQCKVCMCNSFGFGGTNAILILEKNNG